MQASSRQAEAPRDNGIGDPDNADRWTVTATRRLPLPPSRLRSAARVRAACVSRVNAAARPHADIFFAIFARMSLNFAMSYRSCVATGHWIGISQFADRAPSWQQPMVAIANARIARDRYSCSREEIFPCRGQFCRARDGAHCDRSSRGGFGGDGAPGQFAIPATRSSPGPGRSSSC